MSDINVFEACIQDWHLTLQQSEGLEVVTADFRLCIWIEIDCLEDAVKPIRLSGSVFQSMELCLCCGSCHGLLFSGLPINCSSEEGYKVALATLSGVGVVSE